MAPGLELSDYFITIGDEFVCNLCHKSFTIKAKVRRHLQTVHTPSKNIECEFCQRTFKHELSLKDHQDRFCNARRVTAVKDELP